MCLLSVPDFFETPTSMSHFADSDPNELIDAVLQLFRPEPEVETAQAPPEPAPAAQQEPTIFQFQPDGQGTQGEGVSTSNATDYLDYYRTNTDRRETGEFNNGTPSVQELRRQVALSPHGFTYMPTAQNYGYTTEGRPAEMLDYADYANYDTHAYSPPPTYVTSMQHPVVSGNFRYETAYMNNQVRPNFTPRPFQLNPNTEAFYPRNAEAYQPPRTSEMPPSYSSSITPGYYSPRPPPIPSYYHHGYPSAYPPVHPVRIRGPVPVPHQPLMPPRPVFHLPPPNPVYSQVVFPPAPFAQAVSHFVAPPSPAYLQPLPVYPPATLFYSYQSSPHDMAYYGPPPEVPAAVTPGQHYDYSVNNNSLNRRRNGRRAPEQQQPRTAKEAVVDPKKSEESTATTSEESTTDQSNSTNSRHWSSDTEDEEVEYEEVEVEEEEEELDLERSLDSNKRDDDNNNGGGGGNCPGGFDEASTSSSPRSSSKDGDKTTKENKGHNGNSKSGRNHQAQQHSPRSARSEKAILRPSYGTTVDLILSEMQDYKYTFYYRGIEFPFTSSCGNSSEIGPLPNFHYFVPPSVQDTDFFGGQLHIWREKVVEHFYPFWQFCNDIWKLQAIPDFKRDRDSGWNSFVITSKLRFACRSCRIPWTSMRGKLQFAFILEKSLNEGFIFLKCFGQVCIQERCRDRDFQTPAFYPEEIDRVVSKLAEYIGYVHYDLPLTDEFYRDPDKAVRLGNPKSPHRRELCHACLQGLCSRAAE